MQGKECIMNRIDENEANGKDGFENIKEDVNDYYDWEMIPTTYADDKKTGVSFKGDSNEYIKAHEMLMKMMDRKGTKYLVNGREFRILDNARNKPQNIQCEQKWICDYNGAKSQ